MSMQSDMIYIQIRISQRGMHMTELIKELNDITIDKNKIYITGKFHNRNPRVVNDTDIISVKETSDSKVHIRKGKGSVTEGMIAGLKSGAGVIQGALYRRGAEVIKGAKYLTIRYLYQGKVKNFLLNDIQQPEKYEEVKRFIQNITKNDCEI